MPAPSDPRSKVISLLPAGKFLLVILFTVLPLKSRSAIDTADALFKKKDAVADDDAGLGNTVKLFLSFTVAMEKFERHY